MAANRHAEAVRCYLEYLCETPSPIEATPWVDWTKVAVVGLALGAGACGGAVEDEGGHAGNAAGGVIAAGGTAYGIGMGGRGSIATGGVRMSGSGGLGALYGLPLGGYGATGGVIANGGTAYGVSGGRWTGAGGRATGGVVATGGIIGNGGTAYGIFTGGRATGGIVANGGTMYGITGGRGTGGAATGGSGAVSTGGITGTGNTGAEYAVPIGGSGGGAGGVQTAGTAGIMGGSSDVLYGLPVAGALSAATDE